MSFETRLRKIEERLKDYGFDQDHPHMARAHKIKGNLYNNDGTEFINNHPEVCPQMFITVTRGEEYHEVPA